MMSKKTPVAKAATKKDTKAAPKYEPPKLTRFEKLERLIIAGE
jgi:hypothetical protein